MDMLSVLMIVQIIIRARASGLYDLAEILAALNGGAECSFRCPGEATPAANPKHTPSSNGCGSHGLKLDTSQMPGFTECCDVHDKCYDSCNSDRKQCDEDFKSCLGNVCLFEGLSNKKSKTKMKQCKTSADMMFATTSSLGCAAYMESQRNACLCHGKTLTRKQSDVLNKDKKAEL